MTRHRSPIAVAAALTLSVAAAGHAQQTIDFHIADGRVVPTEGYAARVSVLGAAITSGGDDVPVTIAVRVGDAVLEPFGSHDDPSAGDVNDHAGVRHYIVPTALDAHAGIDVTATSWLGGEVHLSRNSRAESAAVKVLRDGDPLPDLAGFDGQADAVEFVRRYIDGDRGVMRLHKNQAIYLFEIGASDLASAAADFQDAVVLVTLADSVATLERFDLLEAMYD